MSRRLPSLNALRAFEAAARHVSFAEAADELHVTHAAVSRHIRDLEAWLGVDLFVRTGRGVTLTEAGAEYGRALTPTFDRLAAATQKILDTRSIQRLSISVEVAFASWWLAPRLGSFASQHPRIELDLDPTDELVNFRGDAADLGIRYYGGEETRDWQGVETEKLVDLVAFPVCSAKMLAKSRVKQPRDLKGQVLLHEASKQWWAEWLAAAGTDNVNASAGPTFRGFLALDAATADQGFALADNVVAATGLTEGWLVKPFLLTVPEGAYYMVWQKGTRLTAAAEMFRAWLKAEMAASQSALAAILAAAGE